MEHDYHKERIIKEYRNKKLVIKQQISDLEMKERRLFQELMEKLNAVEDMKDLYYQYA